MDDKKLKAIVEGAVKPILDQLNDPETGLKRLNEKVDANTATLEQHTEILENKVLPPVAYIEANIKAYKDSYQINGANIRKMQERLETVEEKENIQVPPELQLAPAADI